MPRQPAPEPKRGQAPKRRQGPKPSGPRTRRTKPSSPRKPSPRKRASSSGDAWNRNDELLYGIMGGKDKTKYPEDGATYRNFGRTYGGPTDAMSVGQRLRVERGDFSFGEKPKKRLGPIKPKQPSRPKPPRQGRGGNKKAGSMEDMTKRKRYDDIMGYKREFVGKPPKKNVKRGAR